MRSMGRAGATSAAQTDGAPPPPFGRFPSPCGGGPSALPASAMIVFPAIDLKAGQVVRLAEGDMDRATVYGDDPAAQALLFAEAGAEHLHVVDLDGAFAGRAENREAVEAIVAG